MRNKNFNKNISTINFVFDISLLSFLFFYFIDLQYKTLGFRFPFQEYVSAHYKAWILLSLSWYFISLTLKLYTNYSFQGFLETIRRLLYHCVFFSIIVFAVSGLKTENLFSNLYGFLFIVYLIIGITLERLVVFLYSKSYFRKNQSKNALFIDENNNTSNMKSILSKRIDYGINYAGDLSYSENWIDAFERFLNKYPIEYLYISQNGKFGKKDLMKIQEVAEIHRIKTFFIPDSLIDNFYSLEINYFDTFSVFTYKKFPLELSWNRFFKRAFDLLFTFALFALILWWLLPLISIMVYFSQGRPILFKQKRNGLNGKEFDCLKFRTMKPHKFNDIKPTERDDPRVTKLGKILRKTSLDELPQFINVLKGEMSIVGPRPHMVSENESYSDIIKRYSLRHYVKPGITGLAQVKGYRGAIDSDKDMEMRIRTDIYYVRNWSFLLDLFIIYKTAKLMIFGDENAI